jgi:hypothetical protein
VVAGLAPASFLFAGEMASLFMPGWESLSFAAMLLAPVLIASLVFYFTSILLTMAVMRVRTALIRALIIVGILSVCLGLAMMPIFAQGEHSSSSAFSLFGFIQVLDQYRIPVWLSISYFVGLTLAIIGLLGFQHAVFGHESISHQDWQRPIRPAVLAIPLIC